MTHKALARACGMKSASGVRVTLVRAFGHDKYEEMGAIRSARVREARRKVATGKALPRKGTVRPSRWVPDDDFVVRLSQAYVSDRGRVKDIARRFDLRAPEEVPRILRTALGQSAFNKLRRQRDVNRSLRGMDLEALVEEYAKASVSIRVLAQRLGVSRPETLNRILERVLGEDEFAKLRQRRAEKPLPQPRQEKKWSSPNDPLVRRITHDYVAGEKSLDQIASEGGFSSRGHIVYILRSVLGERFEKMRVERKATQDRLRREEK